MVTLSFFGQKLQGYPYKVHRSSGPADMYSMKKSPRELPQTKNMYPPSFLCNAPCNVTFLNFRPFPKNSKCTVKSYSVTKMNGSSFSNITLSDFNKKSLQTKITYVTFSQQTQKQ